MAPSGRACAVLLLVAAALAAVNAEFAPTSRAGIPEALKDAMNPAKNRPGVATAGSDWFSRTCRQHRWGWCRPSPSPGGRGPNMPTRFTSKDYQQVLGMSFLFMNAQYSGVMPATNRVPWRGNSDVNDLIVGGYYEAGNTLKHALPIAQTMMFLAHAGIEFPEGFIRSNQMGWLKQNVKWGTDYLLACHNTAWTYMGAIGAPAIDFAYWGRPEDKPANQLRPAYTWDMRTQGASDLLGSVSSALTAASLLFRAERPLYADRLLAEAKIFYQFGKRVPGIYWKTHPAYQNASESYSYYTSADWEDNMMMAAAWLAKATTDEKERAGYLQDAFQFYTAGGGRWDISPYISWDESYPEAVVLLLDVAKKIGMDKVPGAAEYQDYIRTTFLQSYINANDEWGIVSTPRGLRMYGWSRWGNLRYASSAAFVSLLYAKQLPAGPERVNATRFAKSQIDYALGSTGKSYVLGWGEGWARQAHHAGASCPNRPSPCNKANFDSPLANPQVLRGALIAGPTGCQIADQEKCGDVEGQPKVRYDNSHFDTRSDFVSNEVALEYNGGWTAALAGLIALRA